MFKITHEKYLKESIWESATTGRAEYIEVWKYANVRNILIGHIRLQNDLIAYPCYTQTKKCAADNYRYGFLNDWEIKDWLYQNASLVSHQHCTPTRELKVTIAVSFNRGLMLH